MADYGIIIGEEMWDEEPELKRGILGRLGVDGAGRERRKSGALRTYFEKCHSSLLKAFHKNTVERSSFH
jgi:hypothetical protein